MTQDPAEPASPEPSDADTLAPPAASAPLAPLGWRPVTLAFSVSLAVVLLQFLQTRLYSVLFWNHFVYFIISIALLGFGISGTWLALGDKTFLARRLGVRGAGLLFVVTSLLSTLVVPQATMALTDLQADPSRLLQLLVTYAAAILPYFFAGWVLGIVFREHAARIHVLYFADLIGAGLGCLLFVALIRPVGLVSLLALNAAIVGVPCLVRKREARDLAGAGVLCLALLLLLPFANRINLSILPEGSKTMMYWGWAEGAPDDGPVHEFSEWNGISRIDVVSRKQQPEFHRVFIDGDAFTEISEGFGTVAPFTSADHMIVTRMPYLLKDDPQDVLVIGSGGGIDVWHALRGGATQVDAVEINPTTYRLALDVYREENGGLFHRPEVSLHNEDGRSFVRRSAKKYDVIMMQGVDTFAASNSGAYVLSENYLYTVEGIRDYYKHLKPGGILCISRCYTESGEEALRLFTSAVEALYQEGVPNPDTHVSLHGTKPTWMAVMIKKEPFSEAELALQHQYLLDRGILLLFPPVGESFADQAPYVRFARARASGFQARYFDEYPKDVTPVSDDSPFFFHFEKWRDLPSALSSMNFGNLIRGDWPSVTLAALLLFTLVMVSAFMLVPLLVFSRREGFKREGRGFSWWMLYFMCLGFAFIFIEIALMQRFALLLGHPSRSLVLVLGVLLLSAGCGSFLAGKHPHTFRQPFLWIVGLSLVAAFVYPSLTFAALSLPLMGRALVTILFVAPLGFFMGMPFPLAIRRVAQEAEDFVPWMWGINGGATVFGSVVAILIAMGTGFTVVLTCAAVGYGLALLAWIRLGGSAT